MHWVEFPTEEEQPDLEAEDEAQETGAESGGDDRSNTFGGDSAPGGWDSGIAGGDTGGSGWDSSIARGRGRRWDEVIPSNIFAHKEGGNEFHSWG